jgi:hypothetical protein
VTRDREAEERLEQSLEDKPSVLREISEGLRVLVQEALPEVTERLNPWHVYSFAGRQDFCYLAVSSHHVSFGFIKGTSLRDPGQLLEGTGKNLRHVKFRHTDDLSRPGLRELIAEAVDFDRRTG